MGLLSKTTTLHVHHAFLYIPLSSLHDYDENKRQRVFLSLSLNLSAVPKKSTPGKFTYIRHFQGIGINATVFEKTRIHHKSDVFASVCVDDAKAP